MQLKFFHLLFPFAASLGLYAEKPSKPNILFIYLDDLSYDAVGAYGNKVIKTPNLDALAHQGVLFENAYNMGGWNGAVSIASRSQLLTGRYIWRANQAEKLRYKKEFESEMLLPQIMKNAGYSTFMTGKWHVAHITPNQVFDQVELMRTGGMPADTPASYNRPQNENDSLWLPWDKAQKGFWTGVKHWSEEQADVIIEYIRNNARSNNPHFMYCAFNAPHDPRQAPRSFVDQYPLASIQLPENFLPEHPLNKLMDAGRNLRDERLAPFPRTPYAVRKHRQEYYAIISHLDEQIGRIISVLKNEGMDKNTLIILTSDNGLAVGQHGFLGKQNLYEHSIKVPLIISGYAVEKGQTRTQLVYMQDIVPVMYEVAGVKEDISIDFKSLTDVLVRKNEKGRQFVYGAFMQSQRMLRNDRYKLYIIPAAKQIYLFDLHSDPLEMNNLFGNKKYTKTANLLFRNLLIEAKQQDDPLLNSLADLKDLF
ncbi:MAG: sulfatase-like hydrolase/transferase [Paludibacter sp.]|nr:sulfatase-like hydrolase/transferase [Paludibacter sp.]